MSDPVHGPPGGEPPRHLRAGSDGGAIGWALGAVAAVALFGVSWWAWSEHAPVPASPPAVRAAPAPTTAAPEGEATTGQAPPPPAR